MTSDRALRPAHARRDPAVLPPARLPLSSARRATFVSSRETEDVVCI